MRKNNEVYKKLYKQCVNTIIVVVLTGLFYIMWNNMFNEMMDRKFLGKGNLLIVFSYVIFVCVFMQLWGGFKLGYQKLINVIVSQILAVLSFNVLAYIQIILMIGTIDHLERVFFSMLCLSGLDILSCIVLSVIFINIYVRLFPAHRVLQINGDYENYLSQKIRDRDDKYKICEEISIHEAWDVLVDKIAQYDTVLLNDIPSVEKNRILKYCFDHSIRVYFTPKISDIIVKGTQVINLFDSPLLLCKNIGLNFEQRLAKRTMDILISLVGLILASPIMLITAICIKIDDGGPVFYKQERCTINGRVFSIYKFRSMIVDAEKDGKSRPATEGDDRITKVGHFIRKTRIDELPQLINILVGDMSFVGPRPERLEHVEKYCKEIPEFAYRLKMKGGLTGYAQVYGRYNTTAYDKLKMDLLYIVNYSLLMDIQIIFETVKILFQKESTQGFSEQQMEKVRATKTEKGSYNEKNLDLES